MFQEHLHRIEVTDDCYMQGLITYVHLNHVKHWFAEDYVNYQYSSDNAIDSNKPTRIQRDFVLYLFGGKRNFEFAINNNGIKIDRA